MKNNTFAIYAVPVALLMMAGGLAAPSASADPAASASKATVKGTFTYDRHAPADVIYAKLQQKAERLCSQPGIKHAYMRKYEEACIASVVESGVSRIGRADIAQLHSRQNG